MNRHGSIVKVIQLPDAVAQKQARFGFEGVSARQERGREILYVAFQRDWDGPRNDNGDPAATSLGPQLARIGRHDTHNDAWTFIYYELAEPSSPNGGWVGLSEIRGFGEDHQFALLERDNQAGTDARIKWITTFYSDPEAYKPDAELTRADRVSYQAVTNDLLAELEAPGGLVLEKVEGLTVLPWGKAAIVTDNDGVDDASGETQLQSVDLIDPNE